MLSRCGSSIVTTVLLISGLLLGFVQAEAEDKAIMRLGNQTIERVITVFLISLHPCGLASRRGWRILVTPSVFNSIGLQKCQNRYSHHSIKTYDNELASWLFSANICFRTWG